MNIKVVYRKKDGEIMAFFPELSANYGKIVCYAHIGQHGEAALEYYWATEKANPDEYAALHEELTSIYYDDQLVIRQKINRDDLIYKAWALARMANALEKA